MLARSRKVLITDMGIDDNSASVAHMGNQHHLSAGSNHTNPHEASNASILSSATATTNATFGNMNKLRNKDPGRSSAITPTPPIDVHIVNWQQGLELQYDTILENTIDYLTGIDNLKKLKR
jgi:hypothetical protein